MNGRKRQDSRPLPRLSEHAWLGHRPEHAGTLGLEPTRCRSATKCLEQTDRQSCRHARSVQHHASWSASFLIGTSRRDVSFGIAASSAAAGSRWRYRSEPCGRGAPAMRSGLQSRSALADMRAPSVRGRTRRGSRLAVHVSDDLHQGRRGKPGILAFAGAGQRDRHPRPENDTSRERRGE
jgi:hypothetical protein